MPRHWSRAFGSARLLAELLCIVAGVEIAVMFLLPALAPNVHGWQEALLDATLLTFMAGPVIAWRANRVLGIVSDDVLIDAIQARRSTTMLAVGTFVVGVAVSGLSAWSLHSNQQQAANSRFDRASGQIQNAIEDRFDRAVQGFKGLRSTMTMLSRELTPAEFKEWVAVRFGSSDLPGIRGLGFIKHIQRQDLQDFVEDEWRLGAKGFQVKTSGDAPDLYVINRIEPYNVNAKAWGYDIGSEAVRRRGAEEAVNSGKVTLSGRIQLVQDGKSRPGFLLFMPMYQPGTDPKTPQERRTNLIGLIYAPIVVEEMLQGIGQTQGGIVEFGLFDSPEISQKSWLAGHVDKQSDNARQHLERRFFLYVGGQSLTLDVDAAPTFESEYGRTGPIWAGLLGVVLSAAIALAIWLLRTGRIRAEMMAQRMTQDLQKAKQESESALRETQTLLHTLNKFTIVCVTAPDGAILDVNEAFCQVSGYSRDELVGCNPRLLTSGEHDAMFWINVWQILLHGEPWAGVLCNRNKQGQEYWVNCVISPMRGADGQVDKYISIAYDITETKRVADELKANAERYNLAIDGGNDGLWDWMNVHSHEEWWSPQFFRLLGYEPDEINADLVTFDEMLHPEDQHATFAALEAAFKDCKPFDLEYRLRTKQGQYRWFRSRAKVYFDEWGSATRMAGSIQDIHDRKVVQAKLQEHSEQMGAIFSLSPDGFVSFDAHGKVSYVSPAVAQLSGLPASVLEGMDEQAFGQRFFQQAEPGQAVVSIDELRHQSGRVVIEMKPPAKRMLEVRLSRGQGEAVSQVLAIRDVTHETEIDQMKSAFLSMAAHELRTPMASIYGFTELLLTRELKPEKQKDLLGRIYRQSEAMSGIINELLDLARIESRRGTDFTFDAHKLSDVVADVIRDFKTPDGRAAPQVSGVVASDVVWVDAQKAKQAVLNILSNAYKYSPQGGDVGVRFVTESQDGRARIGVEITDHGIGLTPEQLGRVGERFYRADKSGNIPGTGLGVTIVKEIIEMMGGSMRISSQAGEGTQVVLWMPLMEQGKGLAARPASTVGETVANGVTADD